MLIVMGIAIVLAILDVYLFNRKEFSDEERD